MLANWKSTTVMRFILITSYFFPYFHIFLILLLKFSITSLYRLEKSWTFKLIRQRNFIKHITVLVEKYHTKKQLKFVCFFLNCIFLLFFVCLVWIGLNCILKYILNFLFVVLFSILVAIGMQLIWIWYTDVFE